MVVATTFFFFNDTATTEIYTLSLHDALPILLIGTGGVSLLALRIAKAAGARVVATSSGDAKLARAKTLGADATLNSRSERERGARAAELAGSTIHHVVEVGCLGALAQSIQDVGL